MNFSALKFYKFHSLLTKFSSMQHADITVYGIFPNKLSWVHRQSMPIWKDAREEGGGYLFEGNFFTVGPLNLHLEDVAMSLFDKVLW